MLRYVRPREHLRGAGGGSCSLRGTAGRRVAGPGTRARGGRAQDKIRSSASGAISSGAPTVASLRMPGARILSQTFHQWHMHPPPCTSQLRREYHDPLMGTAIIIFCRFFTDVGITLAASNSFAEPPAHIGPRSSRMMLTLEDDGHRIWMIRKYRSASGASLARSNLFRKLTERQMAEPARQQASGLQCPNDEVQGKRASNMPRTEIRE